MKRDFFKIGVIYALGQFLVKGVSFILIPLYSRKLGPEIYGELVLMDLVLSFMSMFFILSIYTGYSRFYSEDEKNSAFSTALNFSFVMILVEMILLILFGSKISYILRLKDKYVFLILIFFRGIISQLILLLQVSYSLEYKAKKLIILNIVQTILSLSLIIYFVNYMDEKIVGVYKGHIYGSIPVLIYLVIDNKRKYKFIFNRKIFKRMFKFSTGLLLGNLSYLILVMGDRYFLAKYKNFYDVGIYSMGYKIASIIEILYIASFKKIITPYKFKNYKNKDFKSNYVKFFNVFNIIGAFIIILISVNSKLILHIFTTSEFVNAYKVIPLILFSYLLYGHSMFYTVGIEVENKTYIDSFLIVTGGLINIGLNFYVVKRYGMYGAALSTIISYAVMMFMYVKILLPKFNIDFDFKRMFKIFIIMITTYIIYFLISILNLNIIIDAGFGNLIVIIYMYINFKFIINEKEKEDVKNLLLRRRK